MKILNGFLPQLKIKDSKNVNPKGLVDMLIIKMSNLIIAKKY
jgi:hypothetical protein